MTRIRTKKEQKAVFFLQ